MAPVTNEPLRSLLPLICSAAKLPLENAVSGEGLALYEEVSFSCPLALKKIVASSQMRMR